MTRREQMEAILTQVDRAETSVDNIRHDWSDPRLDCREAQNALTVIRTLVKSEVRGD